MLKQLRESWDMFMTNWYKNKTGKKEVKVKAGMVVSMDTRGMYSKGYFGLACQMCSNNTVMVASKQGLREVPTHHLIPLTMMADIDMFTNGTKK